MKHKSLTVLITIFVSMSLSSIVRSESLQIAVASNFMLAAKALSNSFHSDTGVKPRISYGSSGKLSAQIAHGAPFEVFLSADQKMPAYLASQNLALSETQFTYAIGMLSLCSVFDISKTSAAQLLQNIGDKKIALANEKLAPYGLAALEVLTKLKIAERKNARWIRAENASQVFQYLISQSVDYAFIAYSQLANTTLLAPNHCTSIPPELYSPIRQDAILLNKGKYSKSAQMFFEYLKSDQAQLIIKQFGYN